MAKKKTQLDRIIDSFLADVAQLELKRAHLEETIATLRMQALRPVRKPQAKKEPATP